MPSSPVKIFAPAPAGLEALVISGVATAGVNGRVVYAGLKGGYPAWSSDGSQVAGAANVIAEYTGTQWKVSLGSAYSALKTSAAATPVGLTSWTVGTGSGSPTVAAATVAEAAEVFVPASAGGEPDAPAEVFVPATAGAGGYATAVFQLSGAPSVNSSHNITIGSRVFLFALYEEDVVEDKVYSGASRLLAMQNIVKAINGTGTEPQISADTVAHADVRAEMTSESPSTPAFMVIARTAGTAGNSIAVTTTQPSGAWNNATLTGGASGSVPSDPPSIFTPG